MLFFVVASIEDYWRRLMIFLLNNIYNENSSCKGSFANEFISLRNCSEVNKKKSRVRHFESFSLSDNLINGWISQRCKAAVMTAARKDYHRCNAHVHTDVNVNLAGLVSISLFKRRVTSQLTPLQIPWLLNPKPLHWHLPASILNGLSVSWGATLIR